jgi:hypothetical protein
MLITQAKVIISQGPNIGHRGHNTVLQETQPLKIKPLLMIDWYGLQIMAVWCISLV